MLVELKDITHVYNQYNPIVALKDINLSISKHEFIGLIGHTGSGKSTLVQLLNGLIEPTSGKVLYEEEDIFSDKKKLKYIRQKVGLVFQYPEHQLFEESIYKDIAFGPKNLGLKKDEIKSRVKESLELVGLDFNSFKDRSPFNLSGGQQRRVAIAGVLALKPEILILDEPSAGLDPSGRNNLLELLRYLHQDINITIILISHRMEEVAKLATRVVVMDEGEIVLDGNPAKVFSEEKRLLELDLDLPAVTSILHKLKSKGLPVRTDIFDVSEAKDEIISKLPEQNVHGEKKSC